MTEAPQYPVGTIFEMAAIPADARARFLAELPEMLEMLDHFEEANAVLSEFGGALVPEPPIWVDDGKRTRTLTLECEGREAFSVTMPLGER